MDRLIQGVFGARGLRAVRVIGYLFLIAYLVVYRDFSFSSSAAAAYIGISVAFGYLFVVLKLESYFPKLNAYYFFPQTEWSEPPSETEWILGIDRFYQDKFRPRTILFTPAEDGLICVPVLLAGISPGSALVAGAMFAFLHIGGFTYLQSILKGIFYGLVCLVLLPYGILTVVAGHFASDLVLWGAFKLVVWIVKRKAQTG